MIIRQSIPRKISGVYMIRNLFDGKRYIGSSRGCIRHRWSKHLADLARGKHANYRLSLAWNRGLGKEALEFSVIEICRPEDCITREQWWLDNELPEYNIAKKAFCNPEMLAQKRAEKSGRNKGFRHTPETIEKMRKAARERGPMPQWVRDIIAAKNTGKVAPNRGVPMSAEAKAKLSASKKGQRLSPEVIERVRLANTGKKRTAEFCERMRLLNLGNTNSRGRVLTEQHKRNISEAQKNKWASGTRKPMKPRKPKIQ